MVLFFSNSVALAHEISDYVTISSPPVWIVKQEISNKEFDLSKGRKTSFLLVDKQYKYSENHEERFVHFAKHMKTSSAVEDNSSFSIVFDPAYQKVNIHYLRIIREGKVLNKLNLDDLNLYRYETERYRLIFNGDLEISTIITDVRVGDILEYAYTVSGKNSALDSHFSLTLQHQWGIPVQRLFQRVVVSKDIDTSYKLHNHKIQPKVTNTESYKTYTWTRENIDQTLVDSNTPSWYYSYPSSQISSFKMWSEVGHFFSRYYSVSDIPEQIKNVSNTIKSRTNSKKEQLRLALSYVQKEIRYLGIEIGQGGYIPRPPKKVFLQKYGDCKDMTLLLLYILNGLDIEAKPLLVNTDDRGHIKDFLPSNIFDHVIVYAQIGKKEYFLDPTTGEQLGNLDSLHQAFFGKGLIVSPSSPGLIDIKPDLMDFLIDVEDTYDLTADSDVVSLNTVSTYYQDEADYMYNWYLSDGIEAIEKYFIEYYQDTFPSIEQTEPMIVETIKDESKISFSVSYKISDAWTYYDEKSLRTFKAYPEDMYSYIPKFVGATRTFPYYITHPRRVKYTVKIILDDGWDFTDSEETRDFNAFEFKKSSEFKDNVLTKIYRYRTKYDHISSEKFTETMTAIDEIRDSLRISLREKLKTQKSEPKKALFEKWDQDFININVFWIMTLIIVTLIFYNNSKTRK